MSIISCPACGHKISDKAVMCLHCGRQRSALSGEQMAVFQQRKLRDDIYRWTMVSYAAITLIVAGFGWYWWASDGYAQTTSAGPFYLMVGAAMGYAVVRVFLYRAKRKLKELRKEAQ
jgi:hypothetical protein